MKIYGVALLAACFLVGQLIGHFLGLWIDVNGNVGGVGFGMILLIATSTKMRSSGFLPTESEKGILFWSAMYIPIVIAMSSIQNAKAALSGGWVAITVGIIATAVTFLLVPLIAKIDSKRRMD